MPPKSTPSKTTADSARMMLAKSVAQIAQQQEGFTKAVEAFQTITAEGVASLKREIDVAEEEHKEKLQEHEQTLKRRKVEVDLEIQEYQRNSAIKFLQKTEEVPIKANDLEVLRESVKSLKENEALEVEALKKKMEIDAKIALSSAIKTKELEHEAKIAELKAQSGQAAKEVAALKEQIAEQREEIKEQRKLTQSVAEASKQGAISQNFGGK